MELPTTVNAKLQHTDGKLVGTLIHVSRLKLFETPKRPQLLEVDKVEQMNF